MVMGGVKASLVPSNPWFTFASSKFANVISLVLVIVGVISLFSVGAVLYAGSGMTWEKN